MHPFEIIINNTINHYLTEYKQNINNVARTMHATTF